jgi:hypothetical protein
VCGDQGRLASLAANIAIARRKSGCSDRVDQVCGGGRGGFGQCRMIGSWVRKCKVLPGSSALGHIALCLGLFDLYARTGTILMGMTRVVMALNVGNRINVPQGCVCCIPRCIGDV